ncbi:MAG: glycosyl hydrolase-related protein [Bacteroidales bacterium]
MKTPILLILFSLFTATSHGQILQQSEVNPVTPFTYEKQGGKLRLLSYIKWNHPSISPLRAVVNGEISEMIRTSRADSLLLWLPLIGEPYTLELRDAKGKPLSVQRITPMIPADWGYFQQGVIHILQSSHQDIAWMDTPDYCRHERIHDIIIPALEMMKEDSAFTFEMEQTLNLMEFLDAFPDRKEEVIQRYKENRFNWGATYNQPYEGLSSGEQLVRQAYYGRKWILENLPGCDDQTAANIDVPGRTWQFPQIMAKSGIKNLFVSRMREGLYNWYAPDGSKLFTFTPGNYGWASMIWKFFDADAITAFNKIHHRSVLWSDYFKRHAIPPHYAILMSCDATKPRNFKPIVDEWNKIVEMAEIPLPRLVNSTAEQYFNAVQRGTPDFERVDGERPNLWLYIHGPAHYQAHVFKREAANYLPAAESFTTFNGLMIGTLSNYPRALFDRAWKASIYPDHGLGGKNGEITDRIFQDSLEVGYRLGKEQLYATLGQITANVKGDERTITVFNDLTWNRDDLVSIEVPSGNWIIRENSGAIVPSQQKGSELIFHATNIPSMGYRTFRLEKGKKEQTLPSGITVMSNYYENHYYKALLGDGGLISLIDKELNRELLETSKFRGGDVIHAGYTGNGAGEFVEITPLTPGDISSLASRKTNWTVTESGPLYTLFENVQSDTMLTTVQQIKFYHTLKKIDVNISLVNFSGTHNRQFRMALPLNMKNGVVNYEVPMGVLQVGRDEMQTIPGGWAWGGTYTHPAVEAHPREVQNFISAHGNGFGVTLSSCVAVMDWIDPSREQADYTVLQGILLSSHKSCHGLGNWYHQTGTHHYSFSLTSHPEGWKNGYQFGLAANRPLKAVLKQSKGGTLASSHSFMTLSDPFVQLSLVKKADADNGVILRVTEMEGKDKTVTVTFPQAVKRVVRTNLIEQNIEEMDLKGTSLSLPLGHHAIETFKLYF